MEEAEEKNAQTNPEDIRKALFGVKKSLREDSRDSRPSPDSLKRAITKVIEEARRLRVPGQVLATEIHGAIRSLDIIRADLTEIQDGYRKKNKGYKNNWIRRKDKAEKQIDSIIAYIDSQPESKEAKSSTQENE